MGDSSDKRVVVGEEGYVEGVYSSSESKTPSKWNLQSHLRSMVWKRRRNSSSSNVSSKSDRGKVSDDTNKVMGREGKEQDDEDEECHSNMHTKQALFHAILLGSCIAFLVWGLAIALFVTGLQHDREELALTFQGTGESYANRMMASLDDLVHLSSTMAAHMASIDGYVSKTAFDKFFEQVNRKPESEFFSWVPIVRYAERDAFVNFARKEHNMSSLVLKEMPASAAEAFKPALSVPLNSTRTDDLLPFLYRHPWSPLFENALLIDLMSFTNFYDGYQAAVSKSVLVYNRKAGKHVGLNGKVILTIQMAAHSVTNASIPQTWEARVGLTKGVLTSVLSISDIMMDSLETARRFGRERVYLLHVGEGIEDKMPFSIQWGWDNTTKTWKWMQNEVARTSCGDLCTKCAQIEGSVTRDNFFASTFVFANEYFCVLVEADEDELDSSPSATDVGILVALLVTGLLMGCVTGFLYRNVQKMTHMGVALKLKDQKCSQAERANAAKRRFISYILHEVRVPFNALSMSTEILKDSGLCEQSAECTRCLETILSSSSQVIRILNDVLDYSKIEEGKIEIMREYCNINEMLQKGYMGFRDSAKKKGITLSCEWDIAGMTQIEYYGDEYRIVQCLNNLLSNAIKFTPEGGTVSCSAEMVENAGLVQKHPSNDSGFSSLSSHGIADIDVERGIANSESEREYRNNTLSHKCLVIKVKDSGVGMSDSDWDALFRPYVQVLNKETAKAGVGTGLGLCIVKSMLEQHEGTVKAEANNTEPGCTFSVHLPGPFRLTTQTSPHPTNADNKEPGSCASIMKQTKGDTREQNEVVNCAPAAPSLKILVVEDHTPTRQVMGMLLNRLGYNCIKFAENGLVAMNAIENDTFDVILMDNQMPVMNGQECSLQIRKKGIQTPIIACTANVLAEDRLDFENCGVNEFLEKPVKKDDLDAVLKPLVDTKQDDSKAT
eukprot:Nk52_evm8s283 gene=Nk52_evmTU8s283